jgi:hypothetical protein
VLLLGLAAPPALVLLGAAGQPELAVRTTPLFTHTGHLLGSRPVGQLFRCRHDGLRRIDLRAIALGAVPEEALELVLRADGPTGPELRRARFTPGRDAPRGGMLAFEFEPIAGSAGRVFHAEVVPAEGVASMPLGLWTRWRGQRGASRPWGPDLLEEQRQELRFQSPLPDLVALALTFVRLDAAGVVRVTVADAGSGETLRTAELGGLAIENGHAFVELGAPLDSYARELALTVELPAGAALRGEGGSPSFATLHGAHAPDEALLGMTLGGRALPRADLVLRVFTDADRPAAVARRLPPRVWVAWLAWIALVAAALRVPRPLRGRP